MAGQGCGELETSTVAVSLGQGVTALGGVWKGVLGHGTVRGGPEAVGRYTQGCWCPQNHVAWICVIKLDPVWQHFHQKWNPVSFSENRFPPIIGDYHGNKECSCFHCSENYGKSVQWVSNTICVSRCWEQHCYWWKHLTGRKLTSGGLKMTVTWPGEFIQTHSH